MKMNIDRINNLASLYKHSEDLEIQIIQNSDVVFTDLDLVFKMGECYRNHLNTDCLTINKKKAFIMVILFLFNPECLAGKKMRNGLAERIAIALNCDRYYVSHSLKRLIHYYINRVSLQKDVEECLSVIETNFI